MAKCFNGRNSCAMEEKKIAMIFSMEYFDSCCRCECDAGVIDAEVSRFHLINFMAWLLG